MAKTLFYDPTGPLATQLLTLPDDPEVQIDAQVQRTWTLGCVGKFIWPLPDKGLKKRLHRIQAPTLIIWGQQDKLVPPIYAQEFAKRIVSAQVEIVEQAAHMPHLEQLGAVSRMVQGFLPG